MITLIAAFLAILFVAALLGAFRSSGGSIIGSCAGAGCVCRGNASESNPIPDTEASPADGGTGRTAGRMRP